MQRWGGDETPADAPTPSTVEAQGPVSAGYCTDTVRLGEVDYALYVNVQETPPLTGRLISATEVPCDDTGLPLSPERPIEVAEVAGVPVEDAVWFRGALRVRRAAKLPASADAWLS